MPFKPGEGGRPKGVKNLTSNAARAVCTRLVENRLYRQAFAKRFYAGELAPPLEAMVWHYAYGKPQETVIHGGEVKMPAQVIFELHRDL